MIEIKCSKAQYERIIDCGKSYFENDKCFIGKTYNSCPAIQNNSDLKCDECLRRNIKRVG